MALQTSLWIHGVSNKTLQTLLVEYKLYMEE